MTRVFLLAAALAVPLATGHPVQDPPSSLRPKHPPGKLNLTHEHRRTTDCETERARPEAEITCRPLSQPDRSGTSVVLVPVDAEGHIIENEERSSVTIELENEVGPVEAARDLPAGVWDIVWSGFSGPGRFALGPGEELRLRLETATGHCELRARECVLRPFMQEKRALIPEPNRIGR